MTKPSDPAATHASETPAAQSSPGTVLSCLRARFPTGKNQTFKQMVADGRVTVNGTRATKLSQPVPDGVEVRVDERMRPRGPRQSIAPLHLIHEDEDLLVIDKPPGLLTSTVPREKRPTALAIVRSYVEATSPTARVGLIHRLDRDAGGLLVFSKSDLAYQSLKTQFFKHTVERAYEAVVHGSPSPKKGRIESRLIERGDGSVRSTDEHAQGERAITDYEVVSESKGLATVRVTLLTGRKHQIRVHLSERGWPIVGDEVYGGTNVVAGKQKDEKKVARKGPAEAAAKAGTKGATKGGTGLKLRAVRLAFDHPRTGRRSTFDVAKAS